MLFVKFIYMFYEVITRVAVSIILVVIFCNFAVNDGLYVYREFMIIHERASVCFNAILLTIILIVFWFLIKLMVSD